MAYTSDRGTTSNLPTNDPYKVFLIKQQQAANKAGATPTAATPAPSAPKATSTATASSPYQGVDPAKAQAAYAQATANAVQQQTGGLTINGVPFNPNADDPNDPKYSTSGTTILGQQSNTISDGETYTGNGVVTGGGTNGVADTVSPSSTDAMIQQKLDELAAAQKASTLAALDAQRTNTLNGLTKSMNSGLSNLNTAQYNIGQDYYNQRNQAAAQSDIGAYNYAQKAASLGIKGPAAMQNELFRNVGLQNSLSRLGAGEAAQNASIEQQRSTLLNNYNSDLDAANQTYASGALAAGADSDMARLTAEIQAMKDQALKAEKQTTADRQMFLDTIGQYFGDYQAQINKVANDGDVSNDWQINYLNAARQDKLRELEAAQAAAQQQAFENNLALQKSQNGGAGQTLAQLDSDVRDMYSMYTDPLTGQISEAGKQAIMTYIGNYGGQYANQLYSKYGLGGATGSPVDPDVYVQGVKRSAGAQGFNTNQIRDDLSSFLAQGRLTAAQVAYILKQLGLQ